MKRTSGFGFSLLEVLIALLVLAFGVIGIIKFQSELFQSGAVAKQRTIATALAQERLEEFRGYLSEAEYLAVANANATEAFSRDGTTFNRVTSVTANTTPSRFMDVQVAVNWVTPKNAPESVVLRSAVAWTDPANSLRLLSEPDIVVTGTCPTTNVLDGVCVGTAPSAADGQTVSVTYTGGGVGVGDWLCNGGAWVAPEPSSCVASCSGTVQLGNCTGIADETPFGDDADVRFNDGGGGSARFSCGANGQWSFVSGECTDECNLPWGGSIAVGLEKPSYQTSTPTQRCQDVELVRKCTAPGVLSRGYDIGECDDPCLLPPPFGKDGKDSYLAHDDFVTAFIERESQSCGEGERRECNEGVLGGDSAAIYPTCLPPGCFAFGDPYGLGDMVTLFKKESAENCEEEKESFVCVEVDDQNRLISMEDGSLLVETAYHQVCLSDPCSYIMNITFSNSGHEFCGSVPVAQGSFPAGGSCILESSRKKITCTGTFDLGDSVNLIAAPLRSQGQNCSARSADCGILTCEDLAARNFTRSCFAE